mmetsp:Transcript_130364/g.237046  ORF Transcript_130364/g.237046 Transcript_130364/m.237046 type:complete len:834 (-) Transcript_130364:80-2581(-)
MAEHSNDADKEERLRLQKEALTRDLTNIFSALLGQGAEHTPKGLGKGGSGRFHPHGFGGGSSRGFANANSKNDPFRMLSGNSGGGMQSGRSNSNSKNDPLRLLARSMGGGSDENRRTEFVAHPFLVAASNEDREFRTGNLKKKEDEKEKEDQPSPDNLLSTLLNRGPLGTASPSKPVVPDHIVVVRKKLVHEGSMQKFKHLKRQCKEEKQLFSDPDFEPLFNQHVKKWCRPNDITASDFKPIKPNSRWFLFRGQLCVDDVRQGILGDCWLLSALGCLAEFSHARLVHALLPGQKMLCPEGIYLVRLCLGGQWQDILVDDRLPCVGGDGEFMTHVAYCATVKRQLWASLVEKALAKVCGSFEALSGGETSEALSMLTGWPCRVTFMQREDFNAEELWSHLHASKKAGFLLTCTTGEDSAALQNAGLESQHAYSLMEIHQIKDKTAESGKLRLLKIRNPQGEKLWNGAWSRESDCWNPILREKLGYEQDDEDRGVFFVDFSDFQKYFDHCTVCKIRSSNWSETRIALELPYDEPSCSAIEIEASENVECYLSLVQMEKRVRYGPLVRGPVEPLACIGFIVVPADGPGVTEPGAAPVVAVARMSHRANVTAECKLKAGKAYLFIPLSLHRGKQRQVTCACLTSKPASVKQRTVSLDNVRNAWAAYARHHDVSESRRDVRQLTEQGTSLFITQGAGSSIVALAENRGDGYMKTNLAVTSSGLRYMRQQSSTTDWLKPGFAQIVQIALPAVEQTSVHWMSVPSIVVAPEAPADSKSLWHCPELASNDNLHAPFRIEKEPPPELPTNDQPPSCVPSSSLWRPGTLMDGLSRTQEGFVRL